MTYYTYINKGSPQNEPLIRLNSLSLSKKQYTFVHEFIKQLIEKRSLTLSKYKNKKEIGVAMDEALNYNFTKVDVD